MRPGGPHTNIGLIFKRGFHSAAKDMSSRIKVQIKNEKPRITRNKKNPSIHQFFRFQDHYLENVRKSMFFSSRDASDF